MINTPNVKNVNVTIGMIFEGALYFAGSGAVYLLAAAFSVTRPEPADVPLTRLRRFFSSTTATRIGRLIDV